MATRREFEDALERAAEAFVGRRLTPGERQRLVDYFNRATGSDKQKAREALRRFLGIDATEFSRRTKASDDTDRTIEDLDRTIDEWKRGS